MSYEPFEEEPIWDALNLPGPWPLGEILLDSIDKRGKDAFVRVLKSKGYRLDRHKSEVVGDRGQCWLRYINPSYPDEAIYIEWASTLPESDRKYKVSRVVSYSSWLE